MDALRQFEAWFSQLLEAGLGGLLGARLQPVEIAKRLADHLEDRRRVGAGRTYVPNLYWVRLSPATLASMAAFQSALEEELAAFVNGYAGESGYQFLGRVRVQLVPDPALRPERLVVDSDLVDRRGVSLDIDTVSQGTRPIAVPQLPAPETPPLVLVIGRRRIPLAAPNGITLGRALDNDVILDDPSVSRHHARLVPRPGHWLLEDLASAQGSFLNNQRVAASPLRPGDQVRLGRLLIVLEVRAAWDGR